MSVRKFILTLQSQKGPMSEWLGTGLQNRLQQFESAWDLKGAETQQVNMVTYSLLRFILYKNLSSFYLHYVKFCARF